MGWPQDCICPDLDRSDYAGLTHSGHTGGMIRKISDDAVFAEVVRSVYADSELGRPFAGKYKPRAEISRANALPSPMSRFSRYNSCRTPRHDERPDWDIVSSAPWRAV